MRHSNYLSTFFSAKMTKHEKYKVLLTFDGLSKNVKNAVLTYKLTIQFTLKGWIVANDFEYSVRY